jgi:hypothetical protein
MGPPKMPHNNRMSTSGALKTSAIWQKTIGYVSYFIVLYRTESYCLISPSLHLTNMTLSDCIVSYCSFLHKHNSHDPYAGNEVAEPEPSAADEAKAKQVLEVARQQNLTDGANRDDFAQKMYTGLKSGKRRRADLMNQVDPNKEKIMGILQEDTSSSEEEFVEVEAKANAAAGKEEKREKGKREVKKKDSRRRKDSKKSRRHNSSDDDDSSSGDSSQRERDRSRRRRREKDKDKRKRKHRSSRHRDRDSDSSDSDDSDSSDRDRKRKHSKRRKEKKRSRSDHDRRKPSGDKERKRDKDDSDEKPKEEFLASAKFDGSKKGYCFHGGDRGVGYYLDNKPRVDRKVRDEMLKLYQE